MNVQNERCSECGVGPEGPDMAGNRGHVFTCPKHPEYGKLVEQGLVKLVAYRITYKQAHAYDAHRFIVDASDLGLPPGFFPRTIDTDMGNGQRFVLVGADRAGGRLYEQQWGCITLTVAND